MNMRNYWIKVKIALHLPFPLKNHFYKGKRVSFFKNWYCMNCKTIFHLKSHQRLKLLSGFFCPECNSCRITSSTLLSKAIIDKKSVSTLDAICKFENDLLILIPIYFKEKDKHTDKARYLKKMLIDKLNTFQKIFY